MSGNLLISISRETAEAIKASAPPEDSYLREELTDWQKELLAAVELVLAEE